jgi:hypothetical protein
MSSTDPHIEAVARRYVADRLCEGCRARLVRDVNRYRHLRGRLAVRRLFRSVRRKAVPESAVCPGCGAVSVRSD